ncbi:hypothetical protein JR316_0007831 [Psilocybe cubensis]|uniref:Uncharacterized protein n=2 Tax=Psilocybe cubensis TaxID=181762 RepID=A0ACB8GUD3_PSICU|nr:hypothetical protein JR316_0007831 [Psilocybe cubensis]KAH9479243.1 hypothetical protein JR316_0007831 [Psilocybe cubensis]
MSFFNNASNVVVNGGNFTASHQPLANPPQDNRTAVHSKYNAPAGKIHRDDVVAVLHNHSALAGLLDAEERFDAPKCDPSTRLAIIERLTKWVKSERKSLSSSLLWLHGPAGVGKSALMQQLGLLMQEKNEHAASFFFSRTSTGRNNGNSLIVTLAYQLAMNFPPIRSHIAKNLKRNPGIFSLTNKKKLQLLIIDPINKLRGKKKIFRHLFSTKTSKPPRLIIIDGLDECDNKDIQCDILLLIAHAINELHLPLRIIIASRPEAHLISSFNNSIFDKIPYTHINLGADVDAERDVLLFLTKEFKELRSTHPLGKHLPNPWPTSAQIDTLVMKSSGGFIYPTTVLKYIKSPYLRPDECLKVILGLCSIPTSDRPYAQLDDLYSYIFNSAHDAHKESIKLLFSILVIPRTEYDNLGNFATPALLDKLLFFPLGHVEQVLGNFLCLVSLQGAQRPIKLLHASLSDFLLDIKRSGEFCADLGLAHKALARGYSTLGLQCMQDGQSGGIQVEQSIMPLGPHHCYDLAAEHSEFAFKNGIPFYEAYAQLDKLHGLVIPFAPFLFKCIDSPKVQLQWELNRHNITDFRSILCLFDEFREEANVRVVCTAKPPLYKFLMDQSRSGLQILTGELPQDCRAIPFQAIPVDL